jgi:hypothetical protein
MTPRFRDWDEFRARIMPPGSRSELIDQLEAGGWWPLDFRTHQTRGVWFIHLMVSNGVGSYDIVEAAAGAFAVWPLESDPDAPPITLQIRAGQHWSEALVESITADCWR